MNLLISLGILLLVPNIGAAQTVVRGTEANFGPVASMLEAFSKAFNPRQDNARWPLYAYDVDEPTLDLCGSYGHVLSAHGPAFVTRVSSDLLDGPPRYMGIQIGDEPEFRSICGQITRDRDAFKHRLDAFLGEIEGFGQILRPGHLARLVPQFEWNGTDAACARALNAGVLSSMTDHPRTPPSHDSDREGEGFQWIGHIAESEHSSIEMRWSPVANAATRSVVDMFNSLSNGGNVWQFIPHDPERIGGSFLITHDDQSHRAEADTPVTGMWNSHDIEWEAMPTAPSGESRPFTMWYMSPFCGVDDNEPWYIVSNRKFRIDGDWGFRTTLMPFRPLVERLAPRPGSG